MELLRCKINMGQKIADMGKTNNIASFRYMHSILIYSTFNFMKMPITDTSCFLIIIIELVSTA